MNECTHIGLDVHKDTIAVAVLRPNTTDVDERVIANTPEAIRRLLSRHDPASTSLCYEAGPTGYDTHRTITSDPAAGDITRVGRPSSGDRSVLGYPAADSEAT